jgi:NAD-dependent deacetylase
VRPDIILYGEALDQAKVDDYQRELEKGFDLVCAIGTSQAFPYVLKPIQMMRRRGALTVEINPAHTALSGLVDLCLRQEAIPAMATVWPMPSSIGD